MEEKDIVSRPCLHQYEIQALYLAVQTAMIHTPSSWAIYPEYTRVLKKLKRNLIRGYSMRAPTKTQIWVKNEELEKLSIEQATARAKPIEEVIYSPITTLTIETQKRYALQSHVSVTEREDGKWRLCGTHEEIERFKRVLIASLQRPVYSTEQPG